jgi:hypothetical protein
MQETTRSWRTIPLGTAGAALGIALGLWTVISWTFGGREAPGFPAGVEPDRRGRVMVLGGNEGSTNSAAARNAQPEDLLGARALALGRIAQVELLVGQPADSIRTLNKISDEDQRDTAIRWTVNKFLQNDEAASFEQIEKIRQLSDQLKDKQLQAMFYARMADIRSRMPKSVGEKAPTISDLLRSAGAIAESIPSDSDASRPGIQWIWGLLATGTYGVVGFFASNLLGSALGELGKGLAAGLVVARKNLEGEDAPKSATIGHISLDATSPASQS